ncbi:MAG: hypothetical protein Q4C68_08395 [Moraxella sp.]|nr:hypothetical protein [Moraxella sp.]
MIDLPTNTKQLSRTTINRDSLRRYGDQIIHIIKTALDVPVHELVSMPYHYTSKHKPFKKDLQAAVQAYSQHTNIPENVLLKSRWLDELLYVVATNGELTHRVFLGYRQEWIKTVVLPILNQHQAFIRQSMI